MFYELLSRDHKDGRATGQPSRGTAGLVSVPERYVAGGACPEPVEGTPEDARKDDHIRGRSKSFMKYPGIQISNVLII
jgi:hypothetical protein